MKDGDSVRVAMEQAMTGLFSNVRRLPHSELDDVWIDGTERLLRESWIEQLAHTQHLWELVSAGDERIRVVLEALEDLTDLVPMEGKSQALEIVGLMTERLREAGIDDDRDGS